MEATRATDSRGRGERHRAKATCSSRSYHRGLADREERRQPRLRVTTRQRSSTRSEKRPGSAMVFQLLLNRLLKHSNDANVFRHHSLESMFRYHHALDKNRARDWQGRKVLYSSQFWHGSSILKDPTSTSRRPQFRTRQRGRTGRSDIGRALHRGHKGLDRGSDAAAQPERPGSGVGHGVASARGGASSGTKSGTRNAGSGTAVWNSRGGFASEPTRRRRRSCSKTYVFYYAICVGKRAPFFIVCQGRESHLKGS